VQSHVGSANNYGIEGHDGLVHSQDDRVRVVADGGPWEHLLVFLVLHLSQIEDLNTTQPGEPNQSERLHLGDVQAVVEGLKTMQLGKLDRFEKSRSEDVQGVAGIARQAMLLLQREEVVVQEEGDKSGEGELVHKGVREAVVGEEVLDIHAQGKTSSREDTRP